MTMAYVYVEPMCKYQNPEKVQRPCTPVDGIFDGAPRKSCVYCGKWLEKPKGE